MFRWGFQRQSFSRSVFLLCAERQIRKTDSSDAFGLVFLFPSPGLHVTQLNVDSVFCVSRYFVNGQWGHFLHFWLAGNVLRRRPKQMSFTGKPSCFRSILKLEASSAPSGWFLVDVGHDGLAIAELCCFSCRPKCVQLFGWKDHLPC